jgi:hypothetical protein
MIDRWMRVRKWLRRKGGGAGLAEPLGFAAAGLLVGAVVPLAAGRGDALGWLLFALTGAIIASGTHWLTLLRAYREEECARTAARARLDLLFARQAAGKEVVRIE